MTTTVRSAKRRARRIAADEAHSWARNLRLNNPHAKLLLCMLTQYVNGDGICWVSVPALSEDCELAQNTIRSRLRWLEEIGAIVCMPQWIDEYGRRNGEGRGKRTSDDIRLMIEAEIEFGAGQNETETAEPVAQVSPSPGEGLNPGDETVSTSLALQQPFTSVKGLTLEPEPELPPKPPEGGEGEAQDQGGSDEPEHFAPAWQAWPGHEVMRRDLALIEFKMLSPEKQRLCRAAVPMFAAMQTKLKRTIPPNFHLWIRAKGFDEFPTARLIDPAAPIERRPMTPAEFDAINVARQIASRAPLPPGATWSGEFAADLLALASFASDDRSSWHQVELGSQQFAAWRDRLQAWLGGEIDFERIWLEPYDPQVHGRPAMDPSFRLRKSVRALRVPAPWPPHRDGSWVDNSEVA
jgi:hypothetical protein